MSMSVEKHVHRALALTLCLGALALEPAAAQPQIEFKANPQTGAIDTLGLSGDAYHMNWLVRTDGSQYAWIGSNYGWGLGYFTQVKGRETVKYEWMSPAEVSPEGTALRYREGDVEIRVERIREGSDVVETYRFTNIGKRSLGLRDVGIYTPFADNYPNAEECIRRRTNAQIWDGGSAAYVNAIRMGGSAPHLGLMLTDGAVTGYEIWERGINKSHSQTRGIVALNLPDIQLRPGASYRLQWRLFSHTGNDDFRRGVLSRGGVLVSSRRYVYQTGETAWVELQSGKPLTDCRVSVNGVPAVLERKGDVCGVQVPVTWSGDVRVEFTYDGNKHTHADLLFVDDIDRLIRRRARFICEHQQLNDPADPRDGAYLPYDTEARRIFKNDVATCSPADRDEGGERVGMGVLLAKLYLLDEDPALKASLLRYARFLREHLQEADYTTFSDVSRKGRNRGYNYMWVSEFYFLMYKITGDRQYAVDGYGTLQAMFRHFGYGFYAIGIPVELGLESLKAAKMTAEYDKLKDDFIRTGDVFVKNGLNYPAHEVNYEQSIVAPAVIFLLQLYRATGDGKYLAEAERQLPVLEAFSGFQPSYHLHEISVRHWDGFWFGKREQFGDTFPHYWSTLTAAAYSYYARCTGRTDYQERAENIVRNNLSLFRADGTASCAYLYPKRVDGIGGRFYDPLANDQDWALAYYLLVCKGL